MREQLAYPVPAYMAFQPYVDKTRRTVKNSITQRRNEDKKHGRDHLFGQEVKWISAHVLDVLDTSVMGVIE